MSLHCLDPAASQQPEKQWGRRWLSHGLDEGQAASPNKSQNRLTRLAKGPRTRHACKYIPKQEQQWYAHNPLESRIGLRVRDKQSLGKMLEISRPVVFYFSASTDGVIRKPGVETKQRLFKHKEEIPQGHQTWQKQLQWILMGELGHQSVQLPAVQVCACKEPSPPLTWVVSSGVCCPQTETHLPCAPPPHLCCRFHWQLLPLPHSAGARSS